MGLLVASQWAVTSNPQVMKMEIGLVSLPTANGHVEHEFQCESHFLGTEELKC